jgi:hypothetical protein
VPVPTRIERTLGQAFADALGDRLVALAAYGSSVDDSAIPNFSDFDLIAFLHGALAVSDAITVQRYVGDLDTRPFVYVQSKFVDADARPQQIIVPGTTRVFWGAVANFSDYLHDDQSLRRSGRAWLRALPDFVAEDKAAWSVAAGSARRQRLIRLLMTRLKPTLRAMLVEKGEPPAAAWCASWSDLASRWSTYEPEAGETLASILAVLPPPNREAELACGEAILRLLEPVGPESRHYVDRLSRAAPMRESAMP